MKWPIILSNFNLNLNLKEIRPVTVALIHADRRTDMTKVTGVFSNYANAPKMSIMKPNMRYHNKKTHFVNMVTVVVQQFKNTEPMNHC
jgi:hypothetical protein